MELLLVFYPSRWKLLTRHLNDQQMETCLKYRHSLPTPPIYIHMPGSRGTERYLQLRTHMKIHQNSAEKMIINSGTE
jgi:hypothetical protein